MDKDHTIDVCFSFSTHWFTTGARMENTPQNITQSAKKAVSFSGMQIP
jgi:hypothetical protein